MRRIYVASSWRNKYQPEVCSTLQLHGHEIYDFRNPPNKTGFQWNQIDEYWDSWTREEYRQQLLTSSIASNGFVADYRAMQWADTCVLVLPSGPSSHLEAGYFNGANKRLIIYMPERVEPDLMYLMANHICLEMESVLEALQ